MVPVPLSEDVRKPRAHFAHAVIDDGVRPAKRFNRNSAGVYSKNGVPVGVLLGACDKGAFAETLAVWAMATDGWSRLWYLDRYPAAKAFALEPQV